MKDGVNTGMTLSPRVRGNLVVAITMTDATNSIPACAGEPLLPYLWAVMTTVYPRVCGGTRS